MYPSYPGQRRTKNWRIFFLAFLFVGALSAAFIAVVKFQRSDFEFKRLFPTVYRQTPDASPLFYRSIGTISQEKLTEGAQKSSQNQIFTLQIAVAPSKPEAEKTMKQLRNKNVETYYSAYRRAGQIEYRIRRGIFTSEKSALIAAKALKKSHQVEAAVTPLD